MANQTGSTSNVPLPKGKIFGKTIPTATSGASTAPLTGPMEDDRMTPTDMRDPIPFDYDPAEEVAED